MHFLGSICHQICFAERLELMASGKWDPTHRYSKGSYCKRIRDGIRSVFRKGQNLDRSVSTDEQKNETGELDILLLLLFFEQLICLKVKANWRHS